MLKLRPLTETFRIPYQWDPAIDRSSFTADGALDEKAFDAAYERCVETLDFSPILLPGKDPTWFVFRALKGSETRRLFDTALGQATLPWLTFRVALQRVDNLSELKVATAVDHRFPDFGKIVTLETMDALEDVSRACDRGLGELVTSLGTHVFARSMGASGK